VLEAQTQGAVSALDATRPDDEARYVFSAKDAVDPTIHLRKNAELVIGGKRRARP
jgi:hypothetical protein